MNGQSLESQFSKTKPGDVGIIGDPVDHSLSPPMQNAAFQTWANAFKDKDQVVPAYHRFHVKVDEVEQALSLMKKHGMRGLNVTIPHKTEVCKFMDSLDPIAEKTQAVNTILFSGERLQGFNTDVDGFRRTLSSDLAIELPGRKALVFGAGGTGRVIISTLLDAGIETVFVWNRNFDRLKKVVQEAKDPRVIAAATPLEVANAMAIADLVVNATSVGLGNQDGLPVPGLKFSPHHKVFDVIYHRDTEFLKEARKAGARVAGGVGMLVNQGARSFEIWTRSPAPVDLMRAVVLDSIRKS